MIDSIVNYLAITYAGLTLLKRPVNPKVLGDDSLFPLRKREKFVFNDWSRVLQRLGFTLSEDKCEVGGSESVTFLGHKARMGRVYRDDKILARLLLYPEEYVDDVRMSMIRAEMLDIDSGCQSPLMYKVITDLGARHANELRSNEPIYLGRSARKFWESMTNQVITKWIRTDWLDRLVLTTGGTLLAVRGQYLPP